MFRKGRRRSGRLKLVEEEIIQRRIEQERSLASRGGQRFSVLRFKVESKGLTNLRMSRLLEILKSEIRDTDEVGSTGPSEIAVLLIGTPPVDARRVIDRVFRKLKGRADHYSYQLESYPTAPGG